ncbi:MAG TPA: tetratricopeptide repeat protein [Verrucomicrobiae bacterium]|nr:tetratricopeptide repeat protein [Verrucomicrobiae bacterium]
MLFFLANIAVLTLAAVGSWWLSGYDAKLTGANEREDFIRRAIRCGITLFLVELAFWNLWRYWRYNDQGSGIAYLFIMLPLVALWCGCLSELVAHGFHWLIDPEDHREFDPHSSRPDLDAIAGLIHDGRKEEAIQLCQKLKESGDVNILTLETMLERLGVKPDNVKKPRPLTEADHLRSQGKWNEAEALLNSLLVEDPSNVDAALMLMRLYAQDLRRGDKASEVLRSLETQPKVSSAHIEFARRSIAEWSNPTPKKSVVEVQPESIDELVARRYFGTAIEILEQKIKEHPQDFDLWLKLAEVQGQHCGNVNRAEKIIQQIEANPAFSPEQIELARARLEEWREAGLHRN